MPQERSAQPERVLFLFVRLYVVLRELRGINVGQIRHVVLVRPVFLFRNVRNGVFSGRTDADVRRKPVRLCSGRRAVANALGAHALRDYLDRRLVGGESRFQQRIVDLCRRRQRLRGGRHRCCRLRAHLTGSGPEGLQPHGRPRGVIRLGETACRSVRAPVADRTAGHDREASVAEPHRKALSTQQFESPVPEPSAENRRDAPEQRRKRQLTGSFNSTRIFSTIRPVLS